MSSFPVSIDIAFIGENYHNSPTFSETRFKMVDKRQLWRKVNARIRRATSSTSRSRSSESRVFIPRLSRILMTSRSYPSFSAGGDFFES